MYKLLFVLLVAVMVGCSTEVSVQEDSCESIVDQYERDECYIELVQEGLLPIVSCLQENVDVGPCRSLEVSPLSDHCDHITDQKDRDVCFTTLALFSENYDYCNNIVDQDTHEDCYQHYMDELRVCKVGHFPCRLENPKLTQDDCNEIHEPNAQLYCLALVTEDSSFCRQMEKNQQNCLVYFNLAIPQFTYEADGRSYTYPDYGLTDSMKWIKDNTPTDSVVLAWHDYGHLIRGLGQRDAIALTPSKQMRQEKVLQRDYFPNPYMTTLFSIGYGSYYLDSEMYVSDDENQDYYVEQWGEYSPHKDVVNVAKALITTDAEETKQIMDRYDADYIFLSWFDYSKAHAFFNVTNAPIEYVSLSDGSYTYGNNQSMYYRMLKLQEIEGFQYLYSDKFSVIYGLVE